MEAAGVAYDLVIFESSAHKATQAAELLRCPLGAIVKSLVFRGGITGKLVLVLVSGENRADPRRLTAIFGEPVQPAKPGDVLAEAGYSVGAVPPFALAGDFPVLIDADIMAQDQVWAAAGSAHVLFVIRPVDLVSLSGGQSVELKLEDT